MNERITLSPSDKRKPGTEPARKAKPGSLTEEKRRNEEPKTDRERAEHQDRIQTGRSKL